MTDEETKLQKVKEYLRVGKTNLLSLNSHDTMCKKEIPFKKILNCSHFEPCSVVNKVFLSNILPPTPLHVVLTVCLFLYPHKPAGPN